MRPRGWLRCRRGVRRPGATPAPRNIHGPDMRRAIKIIIVLLAFLAVVAVGAAWYLRSSDHAPQYRTAPAHHGDIVQTIGATGTLVPEDVIDVGAQVNGPVASFGTDKSGKPIDYRSDVEEGRVLAKIDETIYAADVASADAQNSQAQAQVRVAQANKAQADARLLQATLDWERAQRLGPSAALAKADYDA